MHPFQPSVKGSSHQSFSIRLKSKFLLRAYAVVLCAAFIASPFALYVQHTRTTYDTGMDDIMVYFLILATVVLGFGLFQLYQERYSLAAHILVSGVLTLVWAVIFLDRGLIGRLDSIVYTVAMLAILPIVVEKKPVIILIYGGLNIAVLSTFLFVYDHGLELSTVALTSYFSDNAISIAVATLLAYQVYSINRQLIDKMEADMSDRHKAEEQLRISEESNRLLIEAIPDLIFQSDLAGNVTFANRVLERLTGTSLENAETVLNWRAWTYEEDVGRISTEIESFVKSRKKISEIVEWRILDHDGKIRWINGRISKLNVAGRLCLQTIGRDVTERKANEAELQSYRVALEDLVQERTAKLQEAQRELFQSWKMASLGTLTAGVAHELNNPLNFIMGSYEALVRYFDDPGRNDRKETEQYILSNLKTGLDRSIHILKGLHQFSGDSGERNTSCPIHHMIDNCLIMLKSELTARFIVTTEYADKELLTEGNLGELHQVFFIVLRNAIESVTEEGAIAIATTERETHVQIDISDTGRGIPPENLSRITDPFFTTKTLGDGTGLGLSIAYNIVLAHGGTIDFISEEKQGTTVSVKLPRSLVEII